MKPFYTLSIICFILFCHLSVYSQTSVVTQHNDVMRTGFNSTETLLYTSNVNTTKFGFMFSRTLDDQMYAQPLVVSNVTISGKSKNVVYAATVNNTIYAYDADSASITSAYWQTNLTESGMRPPNHGDVGSGCGVGSYNDFTGNIGIVGTPVIDTVSKLLFVVARSVDNSGNFYQYLHAIDITTGADSKKVLIQATVSGTGIGSSSGSLSFDPASQNQRPALLLLNGIIYITYASHCDTDPYHGWILGYDESTLTQKYVFVDNPNDSKSGIWMSGGGPAADALGNIYVASGNGLGTPGTGNLQNSFMKLTPNSSTGGLDLSSYFIPYNYGVLNSYDLDMGVTQVLMIPNTNLAMAGNKRGDLYVVDKDNMGGLGTGSDHNWQTLWVGSTQHCSFAYYKGSTNENVYVWSENEPLMAFPFNSSTKKFGASVNNSSLSGPTGESGAYLSISSNGVVDSTAILWASHAINGCDANQSTCPGILRAIKANDVSTELWNSNLDPADNVGNFAKFSLPTIANGKVYLATFSNKLIVYGLKKSTSTLPITIASFHGFRQNASTAELNWQTALEQNDKGFEVQRSASGDNFQTVGFVATKAPGGNSSGPLDYQYSDTNSSGSATYYRLAQIDLNGNRNYSNVVVVKGAVAANQGNLSLLLIPNPSFGSMMTAKYKLSRPGDVVLKVSDINGRVIQQVFAGNQKTGVHKYLLSNLNLVPGIYIITLELNNELINSKEFMVNP